MPLARMTTKLSTWTLAALEAIARDDGPKAESYTRKKNCKRKDDSPM
jgi:hypothetical protein